MKIEREGYSPISLYFSEATGLLVKSVRIHGHLGVSQETVFEDYRKTGSIVLPHKTIVLRGGKVFQTSETLKVHFPMDIDRGLFEMP